jgi:hypothetical protein
MGLDITAYRKLIPAPDAEMDDGYPVDWENVWLPGTSMEWSESIWPGRADGVPSATMPYRFAEKFTFRAGSYGGYGDWRRWLGRMAKTETAFAELVEFADNEGVIGSVVAAKLAQDFADHADIAGGGWDGDLFQKWREAFEMAADGGAVDFH